MSELVQIGGHRRGLAAHNRTDAWWFEPFLYGAGFGLFVIYTTWAALQGDHYYVGPQEGFGGYLSPFYSPILFSNSAAGAAPTSHALFGSWPGWWPSWIPSSPAILILAGPLSFRMTCYYYRKFYYRSYFLSPPACGVGAVTTPTYSGETKLFLFQNLHRYAMYLAVLFFFILSWDAVKSYFMGGKFGVGVGSIILTINPILIGAYTFGCHSFRHLVGGKIDCMSCSKARYGLWKKVTVLNEKHQMWAWFSLIWVAWADIYVRLVSKGIITDWNTWS
jgi:hypothetical protein